MMFDVSVVGNARIRNEWEEYIAELDGGGTMMYDKNITRIFKKERGPIHHIATERNRRITRNILWKEIRMRLFQRTCTILSFKKGS